MLRPAAGGDAAPAIPAGGMLSPDDAALLNGVSGHVLDYDDVAMDGHPSVVLAAAILAEGWALNRSGRDAVAAYLAGYELWALLYELEPGQMHERGFHPTAMLGAIAAAGACACLRGLDAEKATNAIALSASMAAGLVGNFGTMTKSFHAGRTAQTGVLAARLAQRGFTASPDALEHALGFMRAHSPTGKPDLAPRDYQLGRHWRAQDWGLSIKRYPLCYCTHRAIDAMLALGERHDLKTGEVAEIVVNTGHTQMVILRNHQPQTGLEAKFSMQFAMASALLANSVGLRELTDEFVLRPDVQALMRKVRCVTTTEIMADWDQPFAPDESVSVIMADGRRFDSEPVVYPRGSSRNPMSRDELRQKFIDCAQTRLPREQARQLFDQLANLEKAGGLRELKLVA
jgi:2-methylcitrate dehydratase PrpD